MINHRKVMRFKNSLKKMSVSKYYIFRVEKSIKKRAAEVVWFSRGCWVHQHQSLEFGARPKEALACFGPHVNICWTTRKHMSHIRWFVLIGS